MRGVGETTMTEEKKSLLTIALVPIIQSAILVPLLNRFDSAGIDMIAVLLDGVVIPCVMVLAFLLRPRWPSTIHGSMLLACWLISVWGVFDSTLEPWLFLGPLALIASAIYGRRLAILGLSIAALPLGMIDELRMDSDLVMGYLLGGIVLLFIAIYMKGHRDVAAPNDDEAAGHPSHQRFLALINSMADAVVATDERRRITIYNGAALALMNVNVSLEGRLLDDYLPMVDAQGKAVNHEMIVKKAHSIFISRDYKLVFPDAETVSLFLSIARVASGFGQEDSGGYVMVIRDITKEKSLEEERDEFISVVSHELRTPTAITEGNISNAMLLMDRKSPRPQVVSALKQAHDQAIFLANLINDLATLSRAERGVLRVELEDVSPVELVDGLVADYRREAKDKGLKMINATTSKRLPNVRTSRLYLKEILQNFITNSLKYTLQGSISVAAVSRDDGVCFIVKDTGIGISQSDQRKVFNKFYRAEDYRTRSSQGTGLGLYVTQKLARIIRGEIAISSAPDEGSTFAITVRDYHKKTIS